MSLISDFGKLYAGSQEIGKLYQGQDLIWEPEAQGDPVDLIPGLLWATDQPIVSTVDNPTPPIPLARSGDFYIAFSWDHEAVSGGEQEIVFSLQAPDQWGGDNPVLWLSLVYGVARLYYDDGGFLTLAEVVLSPAPTGRGTWEAVFNATAPQLVTASNGTSTAINLPSSIRATDSLRIGHYLNWQGLTGRRDQTFYRARAYGRVPTATERAEIVAWASQ